MVTSEEDALHRVWFLRTLPGRTGSFLGHTIAGSLIGGLGMILLLLALHRARNLPHGKSFAELHIPERNHRLLRLLGLVILIGVPIGMLYDIIDKEDGYDPTALTHCTIYACFFGVGLCAFYESKGRLPADSHRAAIVFAYIMQGVIWINHHGALPPDVILHVLLGYTDFACAGVVAYSMKHTDSVGAFVAGWALMVLGGLWLITIGLYECCLNITEHEVIIYYALYSIGIFLAVVLVTVHLGPAPDMEDHHRAERRGKSTLLADDATESEESDGSEEEDHRFIA